MLSDGVDWLYISSVEGSQISGGGLVDKKDSIADDLHKSFVLNLQDLKMANNTQAEQFIYANILTV